MKITRLDRLARFGYVARATVYALLAYLALITSRLAHKGPEGDFALLRTVPGGRGVLLVLGLGLLSYGLYKFASALLDADGKGRDGRGVVERLGIAVGGAAYLVMCWGAFKFAAGLEGVSGRNGSKQAAATALNLPLGAVVLAFAALCFLATAALQVRSVVTKSFMRSLAVDAPPFSCTIGRLGLSARAIVFAIVGLSLLRAAWQKDENEVRDLGSALAMMREIDLLYFAVALGLLAFAIYRGVEARYRIVPRVDVIDEGKRSAA